MADNLSLDLGNSNVQLTEVALNGSENLPEHIENQRANILAMYEVEGLNNVTHAVIIHPKETRYSVYLLNNTGDNLEVSSFCTASAYRPDNAVGKISTDDIETIVDTFGQEIYIVDARVESRAPVGSNLGAKTMQITNGLLKGLLPDKSRKIIGFVFEQNEGYGSYIASKMNIPVTWLDERTFIYEI